MNTPTIQTGDCLAILPTLPASCAELAYFDPPFNIGLTYASYHDRRPHDEYLAWLESVLLAIMRVLTPSGSLWMQCGTNMQAEANVMLKRMGLHWRNTVVWAYAFGPHQKRKFVPSWQALHYFTRDAERFTFNADAIRIPSARQTKYRDKRANPKGRIPADVWDEFPRVCGTFKERHGKHSCQTPLALVKRIILACTNPGEMILDPMCGTGTVAEAALTLGRRFHGIELSDQTAAIARGRIAGMPQERNRTA